MDAKLQVDRIFEKKIKKSCMAPLSVRGGGGNYKVPDLKVMDILRANLKTIAEMERRFALLMGTMTAQIRSDQISLAQSCPTLGDPMNRSTPGLPVHHQLPEFTQTHVHRVSVAIQPSHLLSSPSPPAPNPSQHQSLFQ